MILSYERGEPYLRRKLEGGLTCTFLASHLPKSDEFSEPHPEESLDHHEALRSPSTDVTPPAQQFSSRRYQEYGWATFYLTTSLSQREYRGKSAPDQILGW
jgi:hypothetical protein